jgi:predicted dehydrogenase
MERCGWPSIDAVARRLARALRTVGSMDHVKVGIIGAGWWAAENHIPVLQSRPDVDVVAACRLGKPELAWLQDHFHIPFVTEDYREVLDQDLDAVVVSSSHDQHYEHARAALDRGLHVLCEKPMVLHAPEARDLAARAQARRLHFLIPYGWNYSDLAVNGRQIIAEGKIGMVEHVHCHMASAHRDLFGGKPTWWAEHSFLKPLASTWSNPATGGGFLHGQLTHTLGLMFYLTGLEPAEVFALTNNFESGADQSSAISCRFTNGATGCFGGTATMPPRSTYQADIRIFGTEGMLLLDIERPRLELRLNDGSGESGPVGLQPGGYSCVEPLNAFVDLVLGKAVENRSSAVVGLQVVSVLDAAFRSVKSRSLERV